MLTSFSKIKMSWLFMYDSQVSLWPCPLSADKGQHTRITLLCLEFFIDVAAVDIGEDNIYNLFVRRDIHLLFDLLSCTKSNKVINQFRKILSLIRIGQKLHHLIPLCFTTANNCIIDSLGKVTQHNVVFKEQLLAN